MTLFNFMRLVRVLFVCILSFLFCVNCSRGKSNSSLSDSDMEILSRINPKKDTVYVDSLGQVWNIKVESGDGNYTVSPR